MYSGWYGNVQILLNKLPPATPPPATPSKDVPFWKIIISRNWIIRRARNFRIFSPWHRLWGKIAAPSYGTTSCLQVKYELFPCFASERPYTSKPKAKKALNSQSEKWKTSRKRRSPRRPAFMPGMIECIGMPFCTGYIRKLNINEARVDMVWCFYCGPPLGVFVHVGASWSALRTRRMSVQARNDIPEIHQF